MTANETFLNQDPSELQDYLLGHARGARAPGGAQQRALARLASLSVGAGITLGATSALGASVVRATPWLVGKWILIGMSATVLTFGMGERLERAFATRATASAVHSGPVVRAPERSAATAATPSVPTKPDVSASEPPAVVAPAVALKTAVGPRLSARVEVAPPPALAPAPSEASVRLDRELSKLKETRAALAAFAPAAALRVLDDYQREFPAGLLTIEASALRVETVAKLGDRALASQLAGKFLRQHASSPLAPRVRAFADLPTDSRANP